VVLLNTAGFYDGLIIQLRRMDEEGFLPAPLDTLVHVSDEGADALAYLETVALQRENPPANASWVMRRAE
jgi:hypothetical protein